MDSLVAVMRTSVGQVVSEFIGSRRLQNEENAGLRIRYSFEVLEYNSDYVIYSVVGTIINLLLIIIWLLRKNWFPLRERSPFLVIQSLFGNILFQISYPLCTVYLSNPEHNSSDFTVQLLCFCYHFGSGNFFIPYFWR